VAILVMSPGT